MSKSFPEPRRDRRISPAAPAALAGALLAMLGVGGIAPMAHAETKPAEPQKTLSHAEREAAKRARRAEANRQAAIALEAAFADPPSSRVLGDDPKAVRIDRTYDMYLGGLPVAVAKLVSQIGRGAYFARAEVKPAGMFKRMVEARVETLIQGERDPSAVDALAPDRFQLRSSFQKKRFDMQIRFTGDTPGEIIAKPVFKKKSYEIDPRSQKGVLDPMSAIVMALLPPSSGDACRRAFKVFDGRRRFDVLFTGQRRAFESRGRRYVDCDAEMIRIAGFSPKMMRQRRYPFFARFQIVDDGRPLAIRIWGQTDYGVAMASLRR